MNISESTVDTAIVTLKINRKSYACNGMVTLSDVRCRFLRNDHTLAS